MCNSMPKWRSISDLLMMIMIARIARRAAPPTAMPAISGSDKLPVAVVRESESECVCVCVRVRVCV